MRQIGRPEVDAVGRRRHATLIHRRRLLGAAVPQLRICCGRAVCMRCTTDAAAWPGQQASKGGLQSGSCRRLARLRISSSSQSRAGRRPAGHHTPPSAAQWNPAVASVGVEGRAQEAARMPCPEGSGTCGLLPPPPPAPRCRSAATGELTSCSAVAASAVQSQKSRPCARTLASCSRYCFSRGLLAGAPGAGWASPGGRGWSSASARRRRRGAALTAHV